jgi:hypothetical protein
MRHRFLITVVAACIAFPSLSGCGRSPARLTKKERAAIKAALPPFRSAQGLEQGEGYVRYQVILPYKSTRVLRFYDERLRRRGWRVWTLDGSDPGRRWRTFVETVHGQAEIVDQLTAAWGRPSQGPCLILLLRERAMHPSKLRGPISPEVMQQVMVSVARPPLGSPQLEQSRAIPAAKRGTGKGETSR